MKLFNEKFNVQQTCLKSTKIYYGSKKNHMANKFWFICSLKTSKLLGGRVVKDFKFFTPFLISNL